MNIKTTGPTETATAPTDDSQEDGRWSAFHEWIAETQKSSGLSSYGCARRAGLNSGTAWDRYKKDKTRPKQDKVVSIVARGLGVPANVALKAAGYPPIKNGDDIPDDITSDNQTSSGGTLSPVTRGLLHSLASMATAMESFNEVAERSRADVEQANHAVAQSRAEAKQAKDAAERSRAEAKQAKDAAEQATSEVSKLRQMLEDLEKQQAANQSKGAQAAEEWKVNNNVHEGAASGTGGQST